MISVTITLKSTPHQIVLSFKTMEAIDQCQKTDDKGVTRNMDDFGKVATYLEKDVASMEVVDLDAAIDGMVRKAAWRARATSAMMIYFQQHPDLRPHMGSESIDSMFEGAPR